MFRRPSAALLAAFCLLAACQNAGTNASAAPIFDNPFMDAADRGKSLQAEKRATVAPIGQKITWNNPANGDSGIIVPTHDFYDAGGAYCREFEQSAVIGGQPRHDSGKACQQQGGGWQAVP